MAKCVLRLLFLQQKRCNELFHLLCVVLTYGFASNFGIVYSTTQTGTIRCKVFAQSVNDCMLFKGYCFYNKNVATNCSHLPCIPDSRSLRGLTHHSTRTQVSGSPWTNTSIITVWPNEMALSILFCGRIPWPATHQRLFFYPGSWILDPATVLTRALTPLFMELC